MFTERGGQDAISPARLSGLVATIVVVDLVLLVGVPGWLSGPVRIGLAACALAAAGTALALARDRSRRHVIGSVLTIPLVLVYGGTGLMLPRTSLSNRIAYWVLDVLLGLPLIGEPLVQAIYGGYSVSERVLQTAFVTHYAIVGVVVLGLGAVFVMRYSGRLDQNLPTD